MTGLARLAFFVGPLFGLVGAGPVSAWEWSGRVSFEGRSYIEGEGERGQSAESFSVAFEPELYHAWQDGDQSFQLTLFARWDDQDDERSHFDVRELYWQKVARRWELTVGWRKIFWGVTESTHLVDVINQTDRVEDPDAEQKLGQAMVQLTLVRGWGYLDFFVLPQFRERTFPGRDGRLGIALVDVDRARYTSEDGEDAIDWAVRWSHSVGAWDLGLSHFSGTNRTPYLEADPAGGEALIPVYEPIDQTGLDVQGTFGAWLLKFEGVEVRGGSNPFGRAVAGFEVTAFDVGGRGLDLGGLLEVSADGGFNRPDTLFLGTRLTFNDVADTQVLAGVILSEHDGSVINVEASRRLDNHWRLDLRSRIFTDIPDDAGLRGLRQDDYVQLELSWYF